MKDEEEKTIIDTSAAATLGDDCYVHDVYQCGCTKLHIPYHLRNKRLFVRVHPNAGQKHVSLKLTVEHEPPPINDHGWKQHK